MLDWQTFKINESNAAPGKHVSKGTSGFYCLLGYRTFLSNRSSIHFPRKERGKECVDLEGIRKEKVFEL